MKTILTILIFGSFSLAYASGLQDSTQNKSTEQKQIQEQNQQKNHGDESQVKNRNRLHSNDPISSKDDKKRGKDVFIDKDGDGIADTRASGMSFNKILAPEGMLILSGILKEQRSRIEDDFLRYGLKKTGEILMGEWACMLVQA